jgi:protein-S-isoprenylcysteine O-methyltransferase Ste14
MNARRARPNSIPWPPILLVSLTMLAIVLNIVAPLEIGISGTRSLGVILIAAALGIDLWAMRTLHDSKTTIMPTAARRTWSPNGPFRYSRNPIYLANMVLMAGMGFFR